MYQSNCMGRFALPLPVLRLYCLHVSIFHVLFKEYLCTSLEMKVCLNHISCTERKREQEFLRAQHLELWQLHVPWQGPVLSTQQLMASLLFSTLYVPLWLSSCTHFGQCQLWCTPAPGWGAEDTGPLVNRQGPQPTSCLRPREASGPLR